MEISSYLLGKKASGGGGGTDTRWQQIGYEEEPKSVQDGIDYAKEIYDNWDATIDSRVNAFKDDTNLVYFPNVNVENITNTASMFVRCYRLQYIDISHFNTSSLTNMSNMFQYCYGLSEIGDVNPNDNSVSMASMFQYCSSLKRVKSISITKSNNNSSIFSGCSNLETVGEIRTTLTSLSSTNMFENCPNLSNDTLKVILKFLKKLTNQSTSNKKLKYFGLSSTQATLCTTFDEWTELSNNGWTTGY